MSFHPDVMAALAQTRVADLHNAAARARHDSAESIDPPATPSVASVRLDAYPRLCGLPVTIERLTAQTAAAPAAPTVQVAPAAARRRRLSPRRIAGRRRRRPALTRQ